MKMPRRLFSVFAGCFTLFLIGTAFAVRADEKDDLEKQRAEELKRVEAMLKASIDALIAKEKADPNDAKSLYELAVRCWNGDGVEMNLFAAVDLYQRAAEMGYAEAQYTYGMAYLKTLHEILPRAAAKAEGVKWLRKAAEQEDYEAMILLYRPLMSGGAPTNCFEAISWALEGCAHQLGYDSFVEWWYDDLAEPFRRIWRLLNAR